MFFEKRFLKNLDQIRTRVTVPLRIELWNRRQFDFSTDPSVTVTVPSSAALHWLTHHSRDRDREAIEYPYDVWNDFYSLFLGANMVYSCANYRKNGDTLDAAQSQKLDHILNKLMLKPGETLLDVGCGWGALVIRAAQKYGAIATGITTRDVESRWVGMGAGEFIDRYVFPHGELPHVSLALKEMASAGLEVVDVESLRRHYARTCEAWSNNLEARRPNAKRIAGERRYRIWQIYLAGCAYGFSNGWMNLYQVLCSKAENHELRQPPLTREYMYQSG